MTIIVAIPIIMIVMINKSHMEENQIRKRIVDICYYAAIVYNSESYIPLTFDSLAKKIQSEVSEDYTIEMFRVGKVVYIKLSAFIHLVCKLSEMEEMENKYRGRLMQQVFILLNSIANVEGLQADQYLHGEIPAIDLMEDLYDDD